MRFAQFFKQYFSRFLVSLSVFLSSCPPVFAGDGGSWRAFWDHVCGLALIGAIIVTALFYLGMEQVLDTFFPTRYKITATVEVNGQLYQGSSVQQYYCFVSPKWVGSMFTDSCSFTHAEAVVVDLKERGMLFLTLRGPELGGHGSLIFTILNARGQNPFGKSPFFLPRKWSLTPDQAPFMVKFDDLNNPKSVKAVDPKNLAASFGEGVRLKSVDVEATGEWVTQRKVEKILPWSVKARDIFATYLSTYGTNRLTSGRNSGLAGNLQFCDFMYGE